MQVFQFIYRQVEELVKTPLIRIVPLLQWERHVTHEDNGHMSCQSIVGDGFSLFAKFHCEIWV